MANDEEAVKKENVFKCTEENVKKIHFYFNENRSLYLRYRF